MSNTHLKVTVPQLLIRSSRGVCTVNYSRTKTSQLDGLLLQQGSQTRRQEGALLNWRQVGFFGVFLRIFFSATDVNRNKGLLLRTNDIFEVTSRIQNWNQVRTWTHPPIFQHNRTKAFIHLGLFTEESDTVPSINIYVLWSQVGLGWKKRSHVSLKTFAPTLVSKQLINTEPRVWDLFCRFALVHFVLQRWNSFRKWKTTLYKVRFSQSLCKKEK